MDNSTRSNSKVKTRLMILESTLQLLRRNEADNVNMAHIAGAAGVSRQAVYLHFKNRVELLLATSLYLDEKLGIQQRLQPAIEARTGAKKISAFVAFWGGYLPDIYPVMLALMRMRYTDDAAADAWNDRLLSVKDGCRDAVTALEDDGFLDNRWSRDSATDLFWSMLSVENWINLVKESGWSQQAYIEHITYAVKKSLIGVG